MFTPSQCRAARALLDWSQQELADRSKIGNATIRNFESGRSAPQHATLDVLRRCFETAGVKFLEAGSVASGPGVSLHKPNGVAIDVDESEVVQYPENLENDAPPGAGG